MQELEYKLLAYLKGELDANGRQQVEQWVALSDANQKAFDEIEKIYLSSEISFSEFNPDVDRAWESVAHVIQKTKSSGQAIMYRVAAVLALIVGLGFIVFQYQNHTDQVVAQTTEGEIRKLELADGSIVWLNENSTFTYSKKMDEENRLVSLNGQAYFDVARDTERPFKIIGKEVTVEVLGTSFDLVSKANYANVNVTSGRVAFGSSMNEELKVVLEKGHQATFKGNTLVRNESFNNNASSWITKDFVFKSSPLSEVVETLSDHFDVKIKVDESIKNCLITSSFEDKELNEILSTLEAIANIKNERKGKTIKLTGPGC